VCVGIRAEFFQPGSGTTIKGIVSFIESHGREILYNVTLPGGNILRSIQSGQSGAKIDDHVEWGINTDHMLIFDSEGTRI
jgi:inositol-phosphate transport system ATP-binding protein